MRITSPERVWRAVAAPAASGLAGWLGSGAIHLSRHAAPPAGLPLTARVAVTCGALAAGLWLAVRISQTHLSVSDHGLADHRLFSVAQVPWSDIAGFEVRRPPGLRGGYCVTVVCQDGTEVSLAATRAYSLIPSSRHLDELHRICWNLEEAAKRPPV